MVYVRGDQAQFNAWEDLGNTGWNWASMDAAWMSMEKFYPPTTAQTQDGASYTGSAHGEAGQIHVGFDPVMTGGPFFEVANTTWHELGISHISDFNGGSTHGFSAHPQTLDPTQNKRWDAATAYYWPVASRTNLHMLQGQASTIWFNSSTVNGKKVAGGVRWHPPGSDPTTPTLTTATREVILCAGSLRSAPILEHSGVGNATLLEGWGIPVQINLPGVGMGLDDQPSNTLYYNSKFPAGDTNNTSYTTFVTAEDLFGNETTAMANTVKSGIPGWAAQQSGGNAAVASALETQFNMQHDLMFNQGVTVAEIVTQMGGSTATVDYWNLLPFGRGSVHIHNQADFSDSAADLAWFRIHFDSTLQTALGRFAERLWTTAPASNYVTGRSNPSTSTLPLDATDAQWDAWHRSSCGSPAHPQGTLSMKSRDLFGVVDSNLAVYGTTNIRVADASTIPTQFSGHTSAIVYAIAERCAQAILANKS
jgi:choline dehydrogenase